jgi:signal peptidase I
MLVRRPDGTLLDPPATDADRAPGGEAADAPAARERRRLLRLRILLPVLVALAFLAWGFTTNYIPSHSMEPTLRPGDHILAMRAWLAYPRGRIPSRGDIITFLPPDEAIQHEGPPAPRAVVRREVWIKRVVGLPGEVVFIVGGRVFINGSPLPRQFYAGRPNLYQYRYPYASFAALTLAKDQLFVLGDNPEDSDDSRSWGPLPRDRVVGRFVAVLFNEGARGVNQRRADEEGS